MLSDDGQEWREQAKWVLSELFSASDIFPVTIRVRKDRASNDVFVTGGHGRKVVDINTYWVGVLAQFALFLEENNAKGEIWFDQLGSRKEETRKQASWEHLRDGEWGVKPKYQAALRRIVPTVRFVDSRTEPLIQIAGFVSGVLRAASEGDEDFLLRLLHEYFPKGPRTYALVHVE